MFGKNRGVDAAHPPEESIADLVHRALIQAGDMQAAPEKLKEIIQRSSAAVRAAKDRPE